eukprot:TRINITY_DN1108_c0_g1_i1.p1 TRINITY_DN1108_c0_g1~~TRINITY_DN1108_c0_g1_i1.p1  ORF type:complete len:1586 (-),score=287.00 TRINITY_DN1108_c0_g1_i1:35-4792(-)
MRPTTTSTRTIVLTCIIIACARLSVLAQSTYIMSSLVLDQSPRRYSWSDFQWQNTADPGIVTTSLNVTSRTPIYAWGDKPSAKGTVHNQTTFNTWFNPSPFTKGVIVNLTLTNSAGSPRVYSYNNQNNFPLDGLGFDSPAGTDQYKGNDNKMHNFHFCMQTHARFAYKGGEVFNFQGDDDVFVFLNNQRVVDLGGVHGPQSASFNLDSIAAGLGMTVGNNYRFDFFYCERHTAGSTIILSTSLEVYCSYYDWCDVCEGNGQSCCKPGQCNDNNPCTMDMCAVLHPPTVSCQNIPINCTAPDVCRTASCNRITGNCDLANVTCPADNNLCTLETCDASKGGCIAPLKVCDDGRGVCTTKSCIPSTGACNFTAINCDDNNACTVDACDPKAGCTRTPVVCNDNDPCTVDTCSPSGGCVFTPKNCDDSNACTTDSCSASSGQCLNIQVSCDDNNACTTDTCNTQSGCLYSTVSCDDGNRCTIDGCSSSSGCSNTPVVCPSDACTTSSCSAATGACVTQNITCPEDGDKCTLEACLVSKGGCVAPRKVCDDGQGVCTTKSCDSQTGLCGFNRISCDDNNPCTTDSCDPVAGCLHAPVQCNDGDLCTIDTCNSSPGGGCVFTPKNCDDSNVCTLDSCSSSSGQCINKPISCDDSNACTTDSCDVVAGCQNLPISCNDSNACTADSCIPSTGCSYTSISCDDGNACTNDFCSTTSGCYYAPVSCDDGNTCTYDTCDTISGCKYQAKDCDDKQACTRDSCGPSNDPRASDYCLHTSILCDDNNACTLDSCSNSTGCVYQPVTCSSSNPCDVTSCNIRTGCEAVTLPEEECNVCYNPLSNSVYECDTSNKCALQRCYNNQGSPACEFYANVTCNDNNACTADECAPSTGECTFTTIPCDDNDSCTVSNCNTTTGACTHTPVNCDDGNPCTTDQCVGGSCVNTLISPGCIACSSSVACMTTDYCRPQMCTAPGVCSEVPVVCDDANACTDDTCQVLGVWNTTCSYTQHDCAAELGRSSSPCFPVKCNTRSGCFVDEITCNDNRGCTLDSCVEGSSSYECAYAPLCSSTDLCTPLLCLEANATCVPAPVDCNDNNLCTVDTCSGGLCAHTPVNCDDGDLCTTDTCTSGNCTHTPINCDDGNPCTTDTCLGGVCLNTLVAEGCVACGPNACITSDYCSPMICAADKTCMRQPISCDDKNKCTDDECVVHGPWNTTCEYSLHNCSADLSGVDACHQAKCNQDTGCYRLDISCDDNNVCTNDQCIPSSNGTLPVCANTYLCPTTDPCAPQICLPGNLTCATVPVSCDDGNLCTQDACASVSLNGTLTATCVHTLVTCDSDDLCQPASCSPQTGLCVVEPIVCMDTSQCTIDSCNSATGECEYLLRSCDDSNPCTIDSCSNTANTTNGCVHTPKECTGNLCNTASCDIASGECILTPISCSQNQTNYCQSSTCDEVAGCLNITRPCLFNELTTDPEHWNDPYPNLWKVDTPTGKKFKEDECFTAVCDLVSQKCMVAKREPWGTECGFAYLEQAQQIAILTSGAIAGVAIAAIVFAALAGFGAKKGYDAWVRMKDERIGAVQSSAIYQPSGRESVNVLYS